MAETETKPRRRDVINVLYLGYKAAPVSKQE